MHNIGASDQDLPVFFFLFMDIERLRAKRSGHRGWATRICKDIETIMSSKANGPGALADLAWNESKLREKKALLDELDEKVVNLLTDPAAVEAEVLDSAEFADGLERKLWEISRFATPPTPAADVRPSTPPPPPPSSPPPGSLFSDYRVDEPYDDGMGSVSSTSTAASLPHCGSAHAQVKLPKLSLPKFSGDPLTWQPFWDAFSATVDTNSSVADVDKFAYLRAHLEGPAAHCVCGFAQTRSNYRRAVELLRERFGRAHLITNAHMQALLQLQPPRTDASSQRSSGCRF